MQLLTSEWVNLLARALNLTTQGIASSSHFPLTFAVSISSWFLAYIHVIMAGTRYARYIALAIVTIAVIFFITSSSSAPEVSGSTIEGYKQSFKGIQEKFRGTHTPISSGGDATTRPGENEEEAATTKDKSPANPPKEPGTTPNYQNTLGPPKASGPRMNATFVTLARNSDLWEISKSIRTIEDRFNFKHNYDWVFLNDKPFDADFKKITTALISGNARYGLIPEAHWSFPEWIDKDKAAQVRKTMAQKKVIYGDSISYRHMCRYESGFFHQHPLMKEYAWYWRVEPSIELFCNIEYDPFEYMANNSMKYSFVISLPEYKETIETLWDSTKKFMKKHPEHVAKDNSMEFVSDDGGETYNRCHFVSFPSPCAMLV